MSLDSRLRLARKRGGSAVIKHYEVAEVCEALSLLRALQRVEARAPTPAPADGRFTGEDE